MIVEVKAQHSAPSPPYGSIQWRLLRTRSAVTGSFWDPRHLKLEEHHLYETVWVR